MIFKIKAALVALLVIAVILRVVLWAIEPAIPLAIVGIGLIFVYSWLFRRKW